MIYQDTARNHEPIDAALSASKAETEAIMDMLVRRDGVSGIVRSMRQWLAEQDAETKGEHIGSNYVVHGEAARQIRRSVAEASMGEAATGQVVTIHGHINPLPESLTTEMRRLDSGDDALRMGQAPTDATEFEQEFPVSNKRLSADLQTYERLEHSSSQ